MAVPSKGNSLPADQSTARLVARIERLPLSRFHIKARVLVGTATFFDAFDALSIAYILPVLVPLWGLTPAMIGGLISIGYVGQLVGALLLGWLAERRGRMFALLLSVAVFALFSLLAASSWDYTSLFIFRTLQGVGLGGEVPVAATYINEISKAKGRGRFVLLYELIFPVGLLTAAFVGWWVVPSWGWQTMFLIGGLPALLVLPLRWLLPESPRWLANRGRLKEADVIVTQLEVEASRGGKIELPPVVETPPVVERKTRWQELFRGRYRRRTLVVWVLWFSVYLSTYGISTWLPTIYASVFNLPLADALRYPLITSSFGLVGTLACALLIDRTGRKIWFTVAAMVGGLLLLTLWWLGASSALQVLVLATAAHMSFNTIALGLYLYTPEIYPTRMRALGSSIGSAWLRAASAIGPFVMGFVVATGRLSTAFLLFGAVLMAASVITGLFGTETKGRVLEEISP